MGRYTLTSDNRLIPSPAENRGRPRKVRVEKTKQIPIGTAQDIAKVRGPAETSLPRKPSSSSPVVRTSVIQGSIHPGMEGSPKPSDRGPDGHMMFPQHMDRRYVGLFNSFSIRNVINLSKIYNLNSSIQFITNFVKLT